MFRFLSLSFYICIGVFCSAAIQLKQSDVKTSMQEMLSLHVEYKEFNSQLARRALKIFIEQFDPEKNYLLMSETRSYLDPKEELLNSVVYRYRTDDLSEWNKINSLFQKAIARARKLRAEIEIELVDSPTETAISTISNHDYASNERELKERMRNQLLRVIAMEQSQLGSKSLNQEQIKKICTLMNKRYGRIENLYLNVEGSAPLTDHYLSMHVLKAMAKCLDAHTAYFSPEEAGEMRTMLEKQFEGVGVVLRESPDGVVIQDMIKGGPAARSGKIKSGDIIVEIDGVSVKGLLYEELLKKMQGDGKKGLELKLSRTDAQGKFSSHQVRLDREKIVMQDERVQYTFEPYAQGIIGKINLPSFYESAEGLSCEVDMREALRGLKKQGELLGLVLDMRENSGGFLNQAVKVAGLFISNGVIVISKYSQGEVQYLRELDGRCYYNGPLVILTSKASASAAEIVAQALQDYGTALVVGDERTYGKGTIQYQTVTDQKAASFFKVTVGRYYTVSGRSTQIDGVIGDILVPTFYSAFNIGERYLEFPLKSDRIPSAYSDPLIDIDQRNRQWFNQNYIPTLQKKLSLWTQMLPQLKSNSSYRIKENKDYAAFLKALSLEKKGKRFSATSEENFGTEDLQMAEAVNIVKDMAVYQSAMKKS